MNFSKFVFKNFEEAFELIFASSGREGEMLIY
jgi:hypothetical protein